MSIFSHTGYGYSKIICETTTSWFLNKYIPDKIENLEINHRGLKRDNSWGFCDTSPYNPKREFKIELQSYMDKGQYMKVLLHELIHVRQWVEGSLHYRCGGAMYYKDEYVGKTEYHNLPHEIEAFELEDIIYEQYLKETYDVTPDEVSFFCGKRFFSRYT